MDVMQQLEEHGRQYAGRLMGGDQAGADRERRKAERVLAAYFVRLDKIF